VFGVKCRINEALQVVGVIVGLLNTASAYTSPDHLFFCYAKEGCTHMSEPSGRAKCSCIWEAFRGSTLRSFVRTEGSFHFFAPERRYGHYFRVPGFSGLSFGPWTPAQVSGLRPSLF
jgi:hypothetical protein